MFKTFFTKFSAVAIAATTAFISTASVFAQPISPSVNGRYEDLVQTIHCPEDEESYGNFNEYGYWGGGSWCGEDGKEGYWVYDAPNWYVWASETTDELDPEASAYGSYSGLVQILECAADVDAYGDYNNYGYWGGGSWCGEDGSAGYWVYSYPNWYIWNYAN
ncbi:hypothetical protein Lepto7376_2301 [[Leptolyngbya] sp. PCC 7376]|uniref:hypothetical protein n=1 Tax=[Leptolyngbya] sp. PCC 7376 TaxID=111781 RepID=UPI00029ED81E|nr:hypothetical protein [[Leptolyngbya] sp. PCC 7376]AFY38591.1 hypothetical protein Lepto7376_2301 [[Leptolyngbya] sp. PCC 7376]